MTKKVSKYLEEIGNAESKFKTELEKRIEIIKSTSSRYDELSENDLITGYLNDIEKALKEVKKDYINK